MKFLYIIFLYMIFLYMIFLYMIFLYMIFLYMIFLYMIFLYMKHSTKISLFCFSSCCIVEFYFTWPLRKQAANKLATRGHALSPFQGTRQWGWNALPKGTTAPASRLIGDLMIESLWSYPLSHNCSSVTLNMYATNMIFNIFYSMLST